MATAAPSAVMVSTRTKISLARAMSAPVLLTRRIVGRGAQTDVTRRGMHWMFDLRAGVDFAIGCFGKFEGSTARAYEKLVRPGMFAYAAPQRTRAPPAAPPIPADGP